MKFSGFGERKRPESVEVQYDEDKRRFPQSCWLPEPVSIGQDLWKQLRRVTIPVFSGISVHMKIGRQRLWLA